MTWIIYNKAPPYQRRGGGGLYICVAANSRLFKPNYVTWIIYTKKSQVTWTWLEEAATYSPT